MHGSCMGARPHPNRYRPTHAEPWPQHLRARCSYCFIVFPPRCRVFLLLHHQYCYCPRQVCGVSLCCCNRCLVAGVERLKHCIPHILPESYSISAQQERAEHTAAIYTILPRDRRNECATRSNDGTFSAPYASDRLGEPAFASCAALDTPPPFAPTTAPTATARLTRRAAAAGASFLTISFCESRSGVLAASAATRAAIPL